MAKKKENLLLNWRGPLSFIVGAAIFLPIGIGIALLLFNPFTWPFVAPIAILAGLFSSPIAGLIGAGIALGITLIGSALLRTLVFVYDKTIGGSLFNLPSWKGKYEAKFHSGLEERGPSDVKSKNWTLNEGKLREAFEELDAIDVKTEDWSHRVGEIRGQIQEILSDQANEKLVLEELQKKVNGAKEKVGMKVMGEDKLLVLMKKLPVLFHPDRFTEETAKGLASQAVQKINDWRDEIKKDLESKRKKDEEWSGRSFVETRGKFAHRKKEKPEPSKQEKDEMSYGSDLRSKI